MVLGWTKKSTFYGTPYNIAFYRDNDLKLKIVRGKKVDILTKKANAKKLESKPKQFRPDKGPFLGALCNSES